MKYIYLLDRLIQMQYPLPSSFPLMFVECFRACHYRGKRNSLEELKILRKIWTPLLHASTISYMRQEVYNQTKIDLDLEIKEESKRFLKNYFENHFRLNPLQIKQILDVKTPIRKILLPNNSISNQKTLDSAESGLHGKKKVKPNPEPITSIP